MTRTTTKKKSTRKKIAGPASKPRRGRPPVEIDLEKVEALGRLQATKSEIAAFLGVDEKTLREREGVDEAIARGFEYGKASLRRQQWLAAQGGDVRMLIWLGKQWLGQSDRINLTDESDKALVEKARRLFGLAVGEDGETAESDR